MRCVPRLKYAVARSFYGEQRSVNSGTGSLRNGVQVDEDAGAGDVRGRRALIRVKVVSASRGKATAKPRNSSS